MEAKKHHHSNTTIRLADLGFSSGEVSPCCFYRAADDVYCVMHGDDVDFDGPPEALLGVAEALKKVWLVKVRATLGPEASDDEEVSTLNRIVRWSEDCLLYEADPRHVEKLLKEAGLEDCKSLNTPGAKELTNPDDPFFFERSDVRGENGGSPGGDDDGEISGCPSGHMPPRVAPLQAGSLTEQR